MYIYICIFSLNDKPGYKYVRYNRFKNRIFFLETIRFVLNVAVILAAVCTVDVQLLYE